MIITGIDPGTARIGWSVISLVSGKIIPLKYGCIEITPETPMPTRLLIIYRTLTKIFKQYKPDCLSIEDIFFATNAKTAISVGQARGVILLVAASLKIPTFSYSPMTIKQTICGTGAAEKKQVQYMVKATLKLDSVPQPDDTADAIAVALTHAYLYKIKNIEINSRL
jgi:crossover junction endodeoxyribonuclease RuvC